MQYGIAGTGFKMCRAQKIFGTDKSLLNGEKKGEAGAGTLS
jgi:hypothetical protein